MSNLQNLIPSGALIDICIASWFMSKLSRSIMILWTRVTNATFNETGIKNLVYEIY